MSQSDELVPIERVSGWPRPAKDVAANGPACCTLRHLAALREERDRARYIDYLAMADELAVMLCEGRKPTIGWYQRRLRGTELGVRIE